MKGLSKDQGCWAKKVMVRNADCVLLFSGTCITAHVWVPCKKGSSWKAHKHGKSSEILVILIVTSLKLSSSAFRGEILHQYQAWAAPLFWHPWVSSPSLVCLMPSWGPGVQLSKCHFFVEVEQEQVPSVTLCLRMANRFIHTCQLYSVAIWNIGLKVYWGYVWNQL